MTGKRDSQRGRVYAWENRVIAPLDASFVAFAQAQGMVNAIWSEMGLNYPPAVEPLPRQARRTVACANRLAIFLPEQTPSWCLLHEIAHAMSSTAEGFSDGHGAIFMGLYVQLIVRYLRIEMGVLMRSIDADGIDFFPGAQPIFASS